MRDFQERCARWNEDTFGPSRARRDATPEACAFLEEALELCQAMMLPRERVEEVLDHVYGRHTGYVALEVGDVAVTLAVLCEKTGVDMKAVAEDRLARCWAEQKTIREKILAKAHQRGAEPPPAKNN